MTNENNKSELECTGESFDGIAGLAPLKKSFDGIQNLIPRSQTQTQTPSQSSTSSDKNE